MVEATVIEYLSRSISAPVYVEMPDGESEFVLIEKIGRKKRDWIITDAFMFQSYAGSLARAIEIDEAVQEAMDKFAETPGISACRLSSNYNFTDTRYKKYRYQCTYEITHE
ncbi:MAG: hypothetical protein ACOX4I_00685 [Anaerovoracaceae bacterium]|jgi:hypothetical protein